MTTEQLKSLRDAIDAHLRGEPVQNRIEDQEWCDIYPQCPAFDTWNGSRIIEWRPKPKEPLRLFVCRGYDVRNAVFFYANFEQKEKAENYRDNQSNCVIFEMVEVPLKEKQIVKMAKDGFCNCDCTMFCPLNKTGSTMRCTKAEIEAAGFKTEYA